MARLFGWLRGGERDDDVARPAAQRAPRSSTRAADARLLGAAWAARLGELERWYAEHGSRPARTAADPDERSLAEWLREQRRRELTVPRREALDSRVPGWRDRTRHDDRFDATVAEIAALTTRGHALERRHWAFLHRQRVKARAGGLSVDRARKLDKARPGWQGKRA